MATVTFNKEIFEREIGKFDEEMQQQIALFGTPIEFFDNKEIQVEIFPNRPDLLSYQGFKRAFLAYLNKKSHIGLKEYKINKPLKDYIVYIDKSVEKIRPFTSCAIVKNLEFNDEKIKEIIDIQEKLHFTLGRKRKKLAIGIYPLEKISLPITYEALEPDKIKFQPLESYKIMHGLEILQRHPAGREYAHLLAGKQKFPIFIDSNNNILSMPPIINSHLTGKITESTKEVFIECSGFDFEILNKCLNIIVTTLLEMSSDVQAYQMQLIRKDQDKVLTPNLKQEKIKLNIKNAEKLLGIPLKPQEVKTYLERMGHDYDIKTGFVSYPAWRTDILHEVDIIEDIAIAYGYDKLIPELPEISTLGEEDKKSIIKNKIAEILVGLNLLEVSNYHLTLKENQISKMELNEKQTGEIIDIEESKTEYNILRKDLSHYLLKVVSENVDSEYPQKIFEIGEVFKKDNLNEVIEEDKLSIALTPGNFTDLKQIINYLFKNLNLEIELKEPENNFPIHFIEGRVAELFIENTSIGFAGEIHPKILKNWKIKMPVSLCEMSLEKVMELINKS